jgi:hypothetical protein
VDSSRIRGAVGFAFLLGVAFTDRFAKLGDTERGIYIATLAACALTEALLVAPVMLHRLLFQCGLKRELVWIGHRFIVAGLCGLLSAIVGGLLLVIEVCFGGSVAACDETGRLTLRWQLIDPPDETPAERQGIRLAA